MTERTITELHQALIIVLGTTASTCDHEQSASAYESLQAALAELGQLRGERRILNPYLSDGLSEEFPPPRTEPGKFIWRARHCLGVLEDSGNLQHEVGHIQTLCREVLHRERFFRLEDTQRIPPSDAMSEALEAHAVSLEDKLERYASDHFKEETKYRASLEQLLGLTKTNWWKVVIDAAEEALADLPQLRRCAAMLVQVASECDIDGIDQNAFKQLLELERWARDNIEARSRALKEAPQ